jgi:hypothetical protein
MSYQEKYFKYKKKYTMLKNMIGGGELNIGYGDLVDLFNVSYNDITKSGIVKIYDNTKEKEEITTKIPNNIYTKYTLGMYNNVLFIITMIGGLTPLLIKGNIYTVQDKINQLVANNIQKNSSAIYWENTYFVPKEKLIHFIDQVSKSNKLDNRKALLTIFSEEELNNYPPG